MKKYLMIAAFGLGLAGFVHSGDTRVGPVGMTNSINADYGGVDVATNSFFVGLATVPTVVGPQGINYRDFYASTTTLNGIYSNNEWLVYGVNFSSGQCGVDFVSVQVSSAHAGTAREITRFYNLNASSGILNASLCGGPTYLRWPLRAYGNLFWGVNVGNGGAGASGNPFNRADLMYYKRPD